MTAEPGHPPPALHVQIPGRPRAKGSLLVVGSRAHSPTGVVLHQIAVARVCAEAWAGADPLLCPVAVMADFWLPRPQKHYRTGKHAAELRDTSPVRPTGLGLDVDKGLRLVLDALKDAGVYRDDAQVVHAIGRKFYAEPGEQPSTLVEVYPL